MNSDDDKKKVELEPSPNFDKLFGKTRDLYASLQLSEEEYSKLSEEDTETFQDIEFDLLPSFTGENSENAVLMDEPSEEKRDDLYAAFTLNEESEITLNDIQDFRDPFLISISDDGSIWLADQPEENLFRFSHFGGRALIHSFTVPGGMEEFSIGRPVDIICDKNDNFYVMDGIQQVIHKFSMDGQYDTIFRDQIMAGSPMMAVRDLTVDNKENMLLVTDFLKRKISRYQQDGKERESIDFSTGKYAVSQPGSLCLKDAQLYVLDPVFKNISFLDEQGQETKALSPTLDKDIFCIRMKLHPSNNLILLDLYRQSVYALNMEGTLQGLFQAGPGTPAPDIRISWMDIDPDGTICILDSSAGKIICLNFTPE